MRTQGKVSPGHTEQTRCYDIEGSRKALGAGAGKALLFFAIFLLIALIIQDFIAWVMQNIIPAAAFIRGMSEKADYFRKNFVYVSECGNCFEIREVKAINGRSVVLYEFWCNGKRIDTEITGYGLLPSAEFQSYRADWHDKSLKELEDLFGYIA